MKILFTLLILLAGTAYGQQIERAWAELTVTSVLWTPSNTTVALWLDAADTSTITNTGGLVDTWGDKSGNSRHLTATTTTRPTTGTRTINSLNVLDFDGTSDFITGGSWFNAQSSFSLYVVYFCELQNTLTVIANRDGTTGTGRGLFNKTTQTSGTFLGNAQKGFYTDQTNTVMTFSSVWSYSAPNTIINPYTNGVAATSQSVAPEANTNSGFRVGSSKTGGQFYDGTIAEIIFVSGTNTTADRQKFEGYLAWKWGSQAKLPSNHPYKDSAPVQ